MSALALEFKKKRKQTKRSSRKKSKLAPADQVKPKAGAVKASRRTAYLSPDLLPKIEAHRFRSNYRRRCVIADFLRKSFEGIVPIVVDFDLAVAFFLQETHHLNLGAIPKSIDAVLEDFNKLRPLTARQHHIYICAREIRDSIDAYLTDKTSPKPFALRCRTLKALHKLAVERSENPVIVGEFEAVILVDLVGRTLIIGLPPKRNANSSFMSGEVSI